MKFTTMKWIATFLLGILISGCSGNEMVDREEVVLDPIVFTASLEQRTSRTYIEDGKYLRWNTGDQITLFIGSTLNWRYQFDGETGDNAGTFSMVEPPFGTGNKLDKHYAVYPYHAGIKISEAGVITTTIPAEQHFAENSFGLGANTMVAVTKDLEDSYLGFKNVGGYIRLQFYGEDVTIKSLCLKGNADEKIVGTILVSPEYGQSPQVAMATDALDTILLHCGEAGVKLGETKESATSFWIVLAPAVFETGFSVVLTNDKHEEIAVSTTNKVVIERNVVKPMAALELMNPGVGVGVFKEEAPMTDDDKIYVIGGGEITTE